jgi:hypothetical protein
VLVAISETRLEFVLLLGFGPLLGIPFGREDEDEGGCWSCPFFSPRRESWEESRTTSASANDVRSYFTRHLSNMIIYDFSYFLSWARTMSMSSHTLYSLYTL